MCTHFQVRSRSRHSSYRRTLRDLPAQDTPVELQAQITRWRCRMSRFSTPETILDRGREGFWLIVALKERR
ncbi:transposase family protein [Methylocystis echinoides]|uniref:transposase family protein n=1 Tax=Methylocystis echinoides TaxID=29468 RepID=UPI00343B388D